MSKVIPEQRLSQRVIKNSIWIFALRIIHQVFKLSKLLILARFLAPHDFGLLGIALLTSATLETFSQTGFKPALIQKKENIENYLNVAWTILIIRGIALFSVLYLIAPYAAKFFESSESKPIIQVIGLSILLEAFTNIGVIYFQKELEFNKQFIYQLSGTIVDFIVAICIAVMWGNVWALALGLLAGNLIRLIMSYVIHPYRPNLTFDFQKTKELFGFGKWILVSSIIIFLVTQGDDIFVAKLLGVIMLGYYQMAYKISNMPTTEITNVIAEITFPAYAKLQDDIPRLRKAFLKVLQVTACLSFPLAGLIFILSQDFITIFLGEKWMPMLPAMQVLVFAGLVRSIAATAGSVFYAVGKPKIDTMWQVVRFLTLSALIYPLSINWNILGASIAVFISISVTTIGYTISVMKILKCSLISYLQKIIFPMSSIVSSMTVIFIFKNIMNVGILEFIILSFIGISTYLFMIILSDKLFNYRIQLIIKEAILSFK